MKREMKDEIDFFVEEFQQKEKYFKNYLKYAKIIKKEAKAFLGKIRVIVFGSILRKKEVAQDIDVLIISPKLKDPDKKSEVRAKIWKKTKLSSPFEIHLITPKEYKEWYKNFIKEKIEI